MDYARRNNLKTDVLRDIEVFIFVIFIFLYSYYFYFYCFLIVAVFVDVRLDYIFDIRKYLFLSVFNTAQVLLIIIMVLIIIKSVESALYVDNK